MINFGALLSNTSNFLYTYILIALLIFAGIYFTVRTRGVQFRLFPEALRVLGEKKKDGKDISSFQALMISTASRVGTGNIAGVANAIIAATVIGGYGAVFWMWLLALIGAASAFIESTLAQCYKEKHGDNWVGGPAYYIQKALGSRFFGVVFAVLLIACFAYGFNALQAYNAGSALPARLFREHLARGGGRGAGPAHRPVHLRRRTPHQRHHLRHRPGHGGHLYRPGPLHHRQEHRPGALYALHDRLPGL